MTDVFISYAREDEERAKDLAEALEARGWSVWWDRRIPVGKSYSDVIEQHLAATRSVVVLWSQSSVTSQWVQNEAAEGAARNILVPVLLDDARIPLEFRRLHTAKLSDWRAGTTTQELEDVVSSIATLAPRDSTSAQPVMRETAPAAGDHRWRFPPAAIAIAVALIAAIVVALILMNRKPSAPPTDTATLETADTAATTTAETTGTATDATSDTRPVPDPVPSAHRSVGVLSRNGRPQCTATLISSENVLTGSACVRDPATLSLKLGTRDHAIQSVLFRDNEKYVALLKVRSSPGRLFGWIGLRTRAARVRERVFLPHGTTEQSRNTTCEVIRARADELQYRCATQLASVGAPILGSDGLLLGIHRGKMPGDDATLQRGVPASVFMEAVRRSGALPLAPAAR